MGKEAAGSALQLLINLAAIVVAGVLTLLTQRLVWERHRRQRNAHLPVADGSQ